ncbi:hypothetical protein B9Z55_021720 [Caenorhabditis nigoni]|uniref:Uncharacterized protein n=1 Tax=Caenorhabditis nigoni TaxID=1611254 RepID=A0A2G5TTC1_9PELO|nr:hypothetical protein B9Z55_021720 [Caenorhabditis nigoni]
MLNKWKLSLLEDGLIGGLCHNKSKGGGYVRDIIPPNNTETPWNTIAPPANPTTVAPIAQEQCSVGFRNALNKIRQRREKIK